MCSSSQCDPYTIWMDRRRGDGDFTHSQSINGSLLQREQWATVMCLHSRRSSQHHGKRESETSPIVTRLREGAYSPANGRLRQRQATRLSPDSFFTVGKADREADASAQCLSPQWKRGVSLRRVWRKIEVASTLPRFALFSSPQCESARGRERIEILLYTARGSHRSQRKLFCEKKFSQKTDPSELR